MSAPKPELCLEALSALSGCRVVASSSGGIAQFTPQDFVNVVALKEFYKQEGLQQLEYPSLGTMSLQDGDDGDKDLYSSPLSITEGPSTVESVQTTVQINPDDFFHPQYNYDFTNIKDGDTMFMRGNERYIRPCGWNRVALRVIDKYQGGNSWLGTGREAWPVSYQGYNMDGSLGIILAHGGSPSDQPEFLDAAATSLTSGATRGRGIYSTPDVKLAEKYCKKFKSKVDGKSYQVILQNRINPQKRTNCQREDVWLVYIPEGQSDIQRKAIVQESIRPYGLLLKPL